MANLFNYPQIAAFKRPRNIKDIHVILRPRLDTQLPKDGFKPCSDAKCTFTDRFATPISSHCGLQQKILGKVMS